MERLERILGPLRTRVPDKELGEGAIVVAPEFTPLHAHLEKHTVRGCVFRRCGGDHFGDAEG